MSPNSRLKNVHLGLVPPGPLQHVGMVKGNYEYWHYCCDGADDRGWGCGYRTLQTVCSWVRLQHQSSLLCPAPHETGNSSIPHTAGLKNSANFHISKGVQNSVDDGRNDISVIDSGDTSSASAASAQDYDNGIIVVASGNADITQNCPTPFSCKTVSKNDSGSDKDNTNDVVLSVGNINSCSESEASKCVPTADLQDVCNKKCDTSDISVVSSGIELKKHDPPSLSSGETVESSDNPQAETTTARGVPSLREIQEALVHMGDKPGHFVGSRQWIGSYEVCLCLDYFYDVPCKIVHISRGAELKQHLSTLYTHFSTLGSPVMMGGDSDASSKGIVGVCMDPGALLVVDPHHSGKAQSVTDLQTAGWVKWVLVEEFHQTSFYNICLPQLAAKAF